VGRVRTTTWAALLVITVGTAGAILLDEDVNPVVQGLFATVAVLQTMIALIWWRGTGRRDPR
jgi:hypothetical protein